MKVLICVAGMPQAIPTLQFGGMIAHLLRADVTLMTLLADKSEKNLATENIEQAQDLLQDLAVDVMIREGNPAKEIIREMQHQQHGLVVLGGRGDALSDLFLSAVVQRVVKRACAPVLVVKRGRPTLRRILICTGGRRVAEPVIRMGARLAQAADAQVTLLHVTSPVPSMFTGLTAMDERLSQLLQTDTAVARNLRQGASILDEYKCAAEIKLRHGMATQEILSESSQGDYDLIVIRNWLRTNRIQRLWSGNVTSGVIDNAKRPVLAVCRMPQ